MKKIFTLGLLLVMTLAGCAPAAQQTVAIGGSTSVQKFMEEFIIPQSNTAIKVESTYQSTSSSDGVVKAIDGTYTFGTASRELKPEEKTEVQEFVLAYDGIAIAVHPNNKVSSLTRAQIVDIFTGKISNWSEVGGADAAISVVSRESGSGTRSAFEELLDIKDQVKNSIVQSGNGDVANTVAGNEAAIGYISFENLDDKLKGLAVDGVEPTAKNVLDKKYTISRPFLLVWNEKFQTDSSKKLLTWIQENSAALAPESGLIPAE
ncbi:MAG: phosphate ABC transporter substrate-binding protein [Mycoplasmatales bacterium]